MHQDRIERGKATTHQACHLRASEPGTKDRGNHQRGNRDNLDSRPTHGDGNHHPMPRRTERYPGVGLRSGP